MHSISQTQESTHSKIKRIKQRKKDNKLNSISSRIRNIIKSSMGIENEIKSKTNKYSNKKIFLCAPTLGALQLSLGKTLPPKELIASWT